MEKWQNFYIQKMGYYTEPATSQDEEDLTLEYPTYESVSTWGVWCKSIPFKIFEKVKQPTKRSWNDQHGDDEYIPEGGLFLDSYTMKVEFGCKKALAQSPVANVDDVRQKVGAFLEYLRSSGSIRIYSSYTRIGREKVRLDSISDNAKWKSENGEEWLIFEATFKVNDPKTDIVLSINQTAND